jgi:hypothetical protein
MTTRIHAEKGVMNVPIFTPKFKTPVHDTPLWNTLSHKEIQDEVLGFRNSTTSKISIS